ncbi:MAG: CotS family spore coat protein [Clostridiales bacterium]|nr:CotS family spore coat protein [Clostridiales bacterium]
MKNLRYPDKNYLMEYDLTMDFFYELDLQVFDVIPLRKIFILHTNKGKKVLKKVDYEEERINFISSYLDKISDICPGIVKFYKYKEDKFLIKYKGNNYLVMDLIEGREVTFTNPIEFNMAAEFLGNFHKTSQEVLMNLKNDIPIEKNFINKIDDAIKDIREIKMWVEEYKYKNEFDSIFIDKVQEYLDEIQEAKEFLMKVENYYGKEIKKELAVCHNDLAEHNFIIKDEKINLIDFDYLTIDLKVVDIADLLLKGIKNNAFDYEKAKKALREYRKSNTINSYEYDYIYALMKFPRDFYSLTKSYYKKEKAWNYNVFLNRYNNKLINESFRREFLENYRDEFVNKDLIIN